MTVDENMELKINAIIESDTIVLFLKGEPNGAMCGFSKRMVQIFDEIKEKHNISYSTYNVWADQDVYENLKILNNWPTYPQIFIGGQFVGGCDIVSEMYEDSELDTLIQQLE